MTQKYIGMNKKENRLALVETREIALTESEALPDAILLLKYGQTSYTKGGEDGNYTFSDKDADSVLADFAKRGRDIVIDYEHETLKNTRAPAAGWIDRLEKTADGIVGHIKYWLEPAATDLKTKAYRYFSPVINLSRTLKSATGLHSVALTNHPATHNIPALVGADEAACDEEFENHNNDEETQQMNELMKLLGLNDEAENGAEQAAQKINDLLASKKQQDAFLALHESASLDEVTGKIQGMVPATEKNRLELELKKRDADKLVELAMNDGKIDDGFKAWALEFACNDAAGFKTWAEKAPKIKLQPPLALTSDSVSAPADVSKLALNDEERKIYRNLGLCDQDIEKIKQEKK